MTVRAEDYRILVGRDRVTREYVAVVREFPSLSWVADSKVDAAAGLIAVLRDVIEDMESSGERIPSPNSPLLQDA